MEDTVRRGAMGIGEYAAVQDLLSAIKLATGYFDLGKTVDGIPYCIPKSISFASMCQADFEQFYERAVDVILTKIIRAVDCEDLELGFHPYFAAQSDQERPAPATSAQEQHSQLS